MPEIYLPFPVDQFVNTDGQELSLDKERHPKSS
jgi:hypothetical protein